MDCSEGSFSSALIALDEVMAASPNDRDAAKPAEWPQALIGELGDWCIISRFVTKLTSLSSGEEGSVFVLSVLSLATVRARVRALQSTGACRIGTFSCVGPHGCGGSKGGFEKAGSGALGAVALAVGVVLPRIECVVVALAAIVIVFDGHTGSGGFGGVGAGCLGPRSHGSCTTGGGFAGLVLLGGAVVLPSIASIFAAFSAFAAICSFDSFGAERSGLSLLR